SGDFFVLLRVLRGSSFWLSHLTQPLTMLPSRRWLIRNHNLRPWLGGIFPPPPESSSCSGPASGAWGLDRALRVRRTKSGTGPVIPGLARSRAFASRTAAAAASSTDASPLRRRQR